VCPVCGADVPAHARACPWCGADERTGWNEEMTRYDGMDLPEEAFDYDEALRDEGLKPRHRPKGVRFFWWLAGIGLLLAIVALVAHAAFR
jgi:predicted nucleic acid-binding Zn ribbon protein